MRIYWHHFISVLQHKWFVFLSGRKLGVPLWRLVIHDWTKFTPAEFGRYARYSMLRKLRSWEKAYDSSSKPLKSLMARPSFPYDADQVEYEFALAWLNHENRNPHHWGYWIPRSGAWAGRPLPMPETYVREMVADWHGASRLYEGHWDISDWVVKNVQNFRLHPDTAVLVRKVLDEAGYTRFGRIDSWFYGVHYGGGDN